LEEQIASIITDEKKVLLLLDGFLIILVLLLDFSNPTRGMDVCVRLFCVRVALCVGSALAAG
jgi:hypothetical protein